MTIERDTEFRRQTDTDRQTVRKTEKDVRADAGNREQDFDLRRARDAPSSGRTHKKHPKGRMEETFAVPEPVDGYTPQAQNNLTEADPSDMPDRFFAENGSYQEIGSRNETAFDPASHSTVFQETADGKEVSEHTADSGQKKDRLQRGGRYQRKFQEQAQSEEQPSSVGEEPKKTSKLEFTTDELPLETDSRKLTHARRKAERAEQKLEQAEKRLPSRKKLRMETVSDPETGKAKKRLKFETEVKPQQAHIKGPLPLRPVKAGANLAVGYAHKKVYQSEEENIGIKAAHRTELAGEAGLRYAYRRHKTAPYRKTARFQKKAAKAQVHAAYQKVLQENPKLKKNLLARMWQKKKLKRQYAKAVREAQKAGKRAKQTAVTTEKIGMAVVHSVKRHPAVWGIALLVLLVFFLITSVFTAFSNVSTGSLGSIAASTYLAEDQDINNAELAYTEWETDLQMQIDRVESDRPGYDECAATRCCI